MKPLYIALLSTSFSGWVCFDLFHAGHNVAAVLGFCLSLLFATIYLTYEPNENQDKKAHQETPTTESNTYQFNMNTPLINAATGSLMIGAMDIDGNFYGMS